MSVFVAIGGVLGAVLGSTSPCRSSTAVAGLFLAIMGALFVVSGRGSLTGRTVMVRAQMRSWRRVGRSILAFGATLALGASIAYLIAGPGRCG